MLYEYLLCGLLNRLINRYNLPPHETFPSFTCLPLPAVLIWLPIYVWSLTSHLHRSFVVLELSFDALSPQVAMLTHRVSGLGPDVPNEPHQLGTDSPSCSFFIHSQASLTQDLSPRIDSVTTTSRQKRRRTRYLIIDLLPLCRYDTIKFPTNMLHNLARKTSLSWRPHIRGTPNLIKPNALHWSIKSPWGIKRSKYVHDSFRERRILMCNLTRFSDLVPKSAAK